jgi:hypothetical protein
MSTAVGGVLEMWNGGGGRRGVFAPLTSLSQIYRADVDQVIRSPVTCTINRRSLLLWVYELMTSWELEHSSLY